MPNLETLSNTLKILSVDIIQMARIHKAHFYNIYITKGLSVTTVQIVIGGYCTLPAEAMFSSKDCAVG